MPAGWSCASLCNAVCNNCRYLRSVFDPDRWEKHRGTGRYVRHILGVIE